MLLYTVNKDCKLFRKAFSNDNLIQDFSYVYVEDAETIVSSFLIYTTIK